MQTLEDPELEYVEENDSIEERTVAQKKMVKEERLNSIFGLPPQEKTIKTFSCFLVAEILIQGSMAVTEHHVCFCSNIPGVKRNIKIKFSHVTAITKEKVYAIFPTAIGIHTEQGKTTFSYVTSRDKLLQLLNSRWSHAVESEDSGPSTADADVVEAVAAPALSRMRLPAGISSSSEASAINDGDSGVAFSPSGDSADDSDAADVVEDDDISQYETEDSRPQSPWQRLMRMVDADTFPRGRGVAVIGVLLVLSAAAVIILSIRLHQLQQQMLILLTEQSPGGLSEQQRLQFRLGGLLESLGSLQRRLAVLKDSLHRLPTGGSS